METEIYVFYRVNGSRSNVIGCGATRVPYEEQLRRKQKMVEELLVKARAGLKEWANELGWLAGYAVVANDICIYGMKREECTKGEQ
jgi:uncharacterized protein YfaA (DUF2138 family)